MGRIGQVIIVSTGACIVALVLEAVLRLGHTHPIQVFLTNIVIGIISVCNIMAGLLYMYKGSGKHWMVILAMCLSIVLAIAMAAYYMAVKAGLP